MTPQSVQATDTTPRRPRLRALRALRAMWLLAALLVAVPLLAVASATPASALTGTAPVGAVGSMGLTFSAGPTVVASGWTVDYDAPTKPTSVALKVDGKFVTTAKAGQPRADVAAAFSGVGSTHGYRLAWTLPPGMHRVCVVAVNVANTGGGNRTLPCRNVYVLGLTGPIDSATMSGGVVQVSGWAIDGTTSDPVSVRVSNGANSVVVPANGNRPDVGAAFPGYGAAHGYAASVLADGANPTCVDIVTATGAFRTRLGCRSVDWRDEMLAQVNAIRGYLGVGPVQRCASLDRAAQGYADEMGYLGTFSHTSWNGKMPWDRMRDAGYNYRSAGENIAVGQPDIASVMDAWFHSPGHFANLVNGSYTDVGFGSTPSPRGVYWVQDFGSGGSCA